MQKKEEEKKVVTIKKLRRKVQPFSPPMWATKMFFCEANITDCWSNENN